MKQHKPLFQYLNNMRYHQGVPDTPGFDVDSCEPEVDLLESHPNSMIIFSQSVAPSSQCQVQNQIVHFKEIVRKYLI
jgi:hypothetical protein